MSFNFTADFGSATSLQAGASGVNGVPSDTVTRDTGGDGLLTTSDSVSVTAGDGRGLASGTADASTLTLTGFGSGVTPGGFPPAFAAGGFGQSISEIYALCTVTGGALGTPAQVMFAWDLTGRFTTQTPGSNPGVVVVEVSFKDPSLFFADFVVENHSYVSSAEARVEDRRLLNFSEIYASALGKPLTVGASFFLHSRLHVSGRIPDFIDPAISFDSDATFSAIPVSKTEGAGISCKGVKDWKLAFKKWEVAHCPPFVPGVVPKRELTVAFIPVRYKGGSSTLTFDQVVERTQYIKEYYYQQSLCSVVISPYIVKDPNTDGWLNLPKTEAEYNPPPTPDTVAQLPRLANIWLDAFIAASLTDAKFLIRQQAPPPFGGFDAIFVIETTPAFRSRTLLTKPIADRLPAVEGGFFALLGAGLAWHAAIAPAGVDLVAGLLAAFGAAFPTGLELVSVLPTFVPALDNTLLKQGAIIASDGDETGIWAHELGHGLFNFWDYYGTDEPFVRGNICALDACNRSSWGLMGSGDEQHPPPIITYNKAIAGWMTNIDAPVFGFGDYPLVPLKDVPFGAPVLRFKPPTGPIDWFIIELRMPPDDVPRTPEQSIFDVPGLGQTGVVIYAKRETRLFEGRVPSCGSLTGPQKLAFDPLMGNEWLSCLDKVTNTNVPALAAPEQFTLVPNTSYRDVDAGVEFSLSNDLILSIKPLN